MQLATDYLNTETVLGRPSYQYLLTCVALRALAHLMHCRYLKPMTELFWAYTQPAVYVTVRFSFYELSILLLKVRLVAFECLLVVGGGASGGLVITEEYANIVGSGRFAQQVRYKTTIYQRLLHMITESAEQERRESTVRFVWLVAHIKSISTDSLWNRTIATGQGAIYRAEQSTNR